MIISTKSIFQATFVIGYEKDVAIRTKQFDIEKAMAPLNAGQSNNSNLPDSENPQAARITFVTEKVSILFSQVAAQMVVNVNNTNDKPLEEILASLAKRINLFQNCVSKIIPIEQQRERGVILNVHYPVDPSKVADTSVFEFIQSQFIRIEPLGVPANATFTVGYQTDDKLFLTLHVSHYKQYQFAPDAINSAIASRTAVDISKLPVAGSGIELKIDVNSRPLVGTGIQPSVETEMVVGRALDFLRTNSDKFMGIQ